MRVNYTLAVYDEEEITAVAAALAGGKGPLMGGPATLEFERRVAELFGKTYGVMVNSGSSANMLALAALKLPPGAEVITPALTFATTVAPILHNGLVPSFVDVEENTFNIDANAIEEAIGPNTRVLMVPDLIGNLPDWPRIREIADQHNLVVVEDSCDTLGSRVGEGPSGRFADISTTSFYASHIITAGGCGGMMSTSDEQIARTVTLLRGWGRSSSLGGESESVEDRFGSSVDGIPYDAKFVFEAVGHNLLPSEMSAVFGLVQLKRLAEFTKRRQENFAALLGFFLQYREWFVLPRQQPGTTTPWLALPLIVRDDAPFTRRELQVYLEHAGIQTRVVFTGNILRQPGFAGIPHRSLRSTFPNADLVMRGGILLGCHQGMTTDQLEYVQSTFREFVSKL